MGSNDLCGSCSDVFTKNASADNFDALLRSTLINIELLIPRVVVNIVMLFNISKIYDLTNTSPYCRLLRSIGTVFECYCAWVSDKTREQMDKRTMEYNQQLMQIVKEYKVTKKQGFAVRMDRVLENVDLSNWPISYISRADCFHPAASVHGILSRYIWNNLFLSDANNVQFDPLVVPEYFVPNQDSKIKLD